MVNIGLDSMTIELVLRLLASVGFGALVGLEREITRKPAGLRTHALVCMGACLFAIASFYMIPPDTAVQNADYSRIAAGIVTGIGFIGGGSIIATKGKVHGITTAASLWIVAAIGLMVGMGNYVLSFITTIISFFILKIGKVEREIENEFGENKKNKIQENDSDGLKIELSLPKGMKIAREKK